MKNILYYKLKEKLIKTGEHWEQYSPKEEHAIEYAHTFINPEPERKSKGMYSIPYLLASSGETINERFRYNHITDIDKQIAATVALNHTKTDIVLYRGVSPLVWELMKENAKQIPHCDLYEKGFLSCSLLKGHEIPSKIRLRIFVPARTPAIYMGNVNYEQKYYEVVINYGAELKIISIDDTYINVELLKTNE